MGVDTTGEVIMAEEVTMGKHNILRVHITIYPIFYFILSNFFVTSYFLGAVGIMGDMEDMEAGITEVGADN
jgi:hypothetical protein